jgi:hypothetical protein
MDWAENRRGVARLKLFLKSDATHFNWWGTRQNGQRRCIEKVLPVHTTVEWTPEAPYTTYRFSGKVVRTGYGDCHLAPLHVDTRGKLPPWKEAGMYCVGRCGQLHPKRRSRRLNTLCSFCAISDAK